MASTNELTATATFAPVPRQELKYMYRKLELALWGSVAIILIAYALSGLVVVR